MQIKKCFALVIGNNIYNAEYYKNLKNPVNEAYSIASVLKKLRFEVVSCENITYDQYLDVKESFMQTINKEKADAALFYFAGHGLIINNRNCLILKDTPEYRYGENKILSKSIVVESFIKDLNGEGDQLNIIIADACRSEPNDRTRGFVSSNFSLGYNIPHLPYQTFIAYSTSPGCTASDGNDLIGHSPYTKALLDNIEEENLTIENLFKKVRNAVYQDRSSQLPWEYTCLTEEFCFNYGQLNPYFEKSYSEQAYKDVNYINDDPTIERIIEGLKSQNWSIQNSIIKEFRKQHKNIIDKNALFVIGRNILQAADGGSFECQKEITFNQQIQYNTNGKNHILNGIIYEIYFNSKDLLRKQLKGSAFLNDISKILDHTDFKDTCSFIRNALFDYKDSFFYIPGIHDTYKINIHLDHHEKNQIGENIWQINSMYIAGQDVTNKFSCMNQLGIEGLTSEIQSTLGIPIRYMNLIFSEKIEESDTFILSFSYNEFM